MSPMPNYVTAAKINSILDRLSHYRAQGIYNRGGASNSATEKA